LEGFLGHDSALQLQDIIKRAAISDKSTLATVIGIFYLIVGQIPLRTKKTAGYNPAAL
jgi:membrane protein